MSRPIVVLCLVMAAGLVACSGDRMEEHRSGEVTLRFWHSFVASTIPSLDTLLESFHAEHPGIRIQAQYVPTGDGLVQKLATAIRSGTAPDLAWIHADFLDKLVEADAISPMSQFLNDPRGLSESEIKDFFPALLDGGRLGGELYALPMEATSLALLYNRAAFRNAGLDPAHPPATWQQLGEYAERLTVDENGDGHPDRYGFLVPVFPASGELNLWMILQWMPFLWQAGGQALTPERDGVMFNSQAGVQALSFWKTLYEKLDIRRFGLAHDLAFTSGRLAMVLDGPWNLPRYRAARGLDWAVAPLPAGPSGRATYLAGELLAIFKQSRAPAEAWEFLTWVTSPRVQAHFSMLSGYLPVRKSVLDLPAYREFLSRDSAMSAFVEQMRLGRARELPDHDRVEFNRVLATALERATVGNEDPKRCLDEAACQAAEFLKKN